MDGRRRDVHGVPRLHLALHQFVPFLDLEQHASGPEEDRLVFLVVVLKAERVALVDVNELADVAVGLRPVQLVSPGFLYAGRFVQRTLSPLNRWGATIIYFAGARTSASSRSTASADGARSARAAACAASLARSSRSTCFASGIAVGAMLNSRSPRPTSSASSTGSAAISPQTAVRMPRRRPARATMRSR